VKFYYLCLEEDVSHKRDRPYRRVAEFNDGMVAVRRPAAKHTTGVASTSMFNSLRIS